MLRSISLCLACAVLSSCSSRTPVELYVDGFAPENVSFDVEDLGALDAAAVTEIVKRQDVDGAMQLPSSSCVDACRAVLVSVFVTNKNKLPESPPVVRLDVPTGRARRLPIAFTAPAIDPGRIGRVRWLVQLWPEETALTATLSSSVAIEIAGAP